MKGKRTKLVIKKTDSAAPLPVAFKKGGKVKPDTKVEGHTSKKRLDKMSRGGKLTASARNSLPKSDFAEPRERKYPVNNKNHARNALARVSQFGSAEEKAKVRAKVHKKYPDIGAK